MKLHENIDWQNVRDKINKNPNTVLLTGEYLYV